MGVERRVVRIAASIARAVGGAQSEYPPLPEDVGLPGDSVYAVPAAGQSLYRVIGGSHARIRDFQANREKEVPRYPDESYTEYTGVSMFRTEQLALENAARFPKIVAHVRLHPGRGFMLARIGADIEGHYCVWGHPEDLLEAVEGEPQRYDAPD